MDKANDENTIESTRRLNLCTYAYRLTKLVKIPVYESQLEINSFYSTVLSIIRRSLLNIHSNQKRIDQSGEDEVEPQEKIHLTESKELELQTLKQLLGVVSHTIRIHPSLSEIFSEDMYTGVFVELNSMDEWIVY